MIGISGLTGESKLTSSVRGILGIALMVLLLTAAVAGFLAWRSGFEDTSVGQEPVEFIPPPEQQALAGSPASPAPQPDPTAAQRVDRVAEQQGGIEARLTAAEQRLTRLDLQAQAAAGNAARAEGLLIAFATRRVIEKGEELGYLADQLRLRFGDGWPNAVETIISMSRDPVTLDVLIARLEQLEPELRNADTEPSLAWLRREIGELFVVRRETSPSPQPLRRMERARLFLESGRHGAAISEVERMPGAAAAEQWLADARRYAAAQRALDLIETAALVERRRLRDGVGNPIGQPSPIDQVPASESPATGR